MQYFYKIKNINTGQYYIGSQYGKMAHPNNLLKTYFTSSKIVKEMGYENFRIVYTKVREDAREYEARFLKKAYSILGRKKFLEILLNRNISPGILLTEENINLANQKRKISNSISAKKLLEEGRHNFQLKNASNYEHVKKMRSERMIGNNAGSKRKMTDELKKKLSEKSKGNTNVKGTKWWTDGKVNKRSIECPGENFKLGTTNGKKKTQTN